MSSTGKRLDLRFGVFACSVQGFDDPVQPVQQILRAIQHLLEETPELADAGINFDPETIEQLIGEVARRSDLDEDQVEIVPGLVMIHHGGGGDLAREDVAPAGAWGHAGEDASGEDYVDIFAAREADGTGAEGENAEYAGEVAPATDEPPEELTARLRRMAREGVASDDANYGWQDAEDEPGSSTAGTTGGGGVFAMPDERGPGAGDEAEEPETPGNLFAADAADGDDDSAPGGAGGSLFAAAPAEDAAEPDEAAGSAGQAAGWRESPEVSGPADAAETDAETGAETGPQDEAYSAASIAERAGARTVPDLMVSAAAFMVLIRGQTQFARRDVLDVFETIPGDHEKTPEARIKGFGKAVRNGRLVEVGDGVFGLARSELERFERFL